MSAARTRLMGVVLLALLCLGASCGSRRDPQDPNQNGHTPRPRPPPSGPRVERLDSVETNEMASVEKRIWVDLINDMLSPCGDPVSVGRCAATGGRCRACVPAARYLARLVMEGNERAEIEELYQGRYGTDSAAEINIDGAPVRGAPLARITIVEFSDFQCPYCGAAHPLIRDALREFEGRVRVVFKQYPLDGHPFAMAAARAAVAAGRQGKFWQMHDMLFENQEHLEDADLLRYAEQLGLDMARFRTDIASPDVQRRIDQDKAEGRRVGVQGTPTLFIGGRQFRESPQSLTAYLREELDQ